MARLRDLELGARERESAVTRSPAKSTRGRVYSYASKSPSPAISESSDKENTSRGRERVSMGPPPKPGLNVQSGAQHSNKRRRTGDGPTSFDTQAEVSSDEPVYDPHQDARERQQVRKGLRELERDIHDYSGEWMKSNSSGLRDALAQQNTLFGRVKQTSDATIDSRFLVKAAVLASKKTKNAALGDGSNGIDIDDFISKCTLFMRQGDEAQREAGMISGTQSRQGRRTQPGSDDEEDADNNGEAHNWAWLGARACFAVNKRPPVPGFLLGPLSVQKRARATTLRRARQQRVDPTQAVKPQELDVEEFRHQDNSGVTQMCKKINAKLVKLVHEVQEAEETEDADLLNDAMERNGMLDDGGISLFHFAVNPRSFGQTVENLFYVSFLIRDGIVGVNFDTDGMPSLHVPDTLEEGEKDSAPLNAQRYQAVIGIDFDDWTSIIETFDIKASLIEHRHEESVQGGIGASGWYGS